MNANALSIFSQADIELAARDNVFHTMLRVEVENARAKHASLPDPHYFYGVLAEEVAEFFDEVRRAELDPQAMLKEISQIAAVAQRCATEFLIPQLMEREV